MNWKLHLIGGIISSILLFALISYYHGFNELVLSVFLLVPIYALLPDIDHKDSTITWWSIGLAALLILVGVFASNVLIYIGAGLIVLTYIAVLVFKHRGITHSIPFGVATTIPIWYFFGVVPALILFAAYWSHLLLDGIPFKLR